MYIHRPVHAEGYRYGAYRRTFTRTDMHGKTDRKSVIL